MDILRRGLAPISDEAWAEIDELAADYLRESLSARKVVDVEGPYGWQHHAVTTGRLEKLADSGGVSYGLHQVLPLIETRIPFQLDIWELDNAVRGARDIDLDPLEEAAEKAAKFEDEVILKGFSKANVAGLVPSAEDKANTFPPDPEKILDEVSAAVSKMVTRGIGGPYALIVTPDVWRRLSSYIKGRSLKVHLEEMLQGRVVMSAHIDSPILVSMRGDDLVMTIGQDLSIGYDSHDTKKVNLYITESFTFQVFEPRAVLPFG
jgi:uncharacterized linocin/CFP29 family protein